MTEFLRSRVIIEEADPNTRTIQNLPTAVFGVVGVTVRGPIATPTAVYSYAEFERVYGGFINGYHTAQAIRAFFDNGGYLAYVSRTCHYTDITDRTSATADTAEATLRTEAGGASAASVTGNTVGPWALTPGDILAIAIDEGTPVNATFSATAASVQNTVDEDFTFSGADPLTLKIDGGATQTVTFSATTYTAETAAQLINDTIYGARCKVTGSGKRLTIESDTKGLASSVQITGGAANTVLVFGTSLVEGTGNVDNIRAVTAAEAKTVIEAALTPDVVVTATTEGYLKISTVDTGTGAKIQVSAGAAQVIFGLDTSLHSGGSAASQATLKGLGKYPGAYANSLSMKVTDASDGEDGHFNLYVMSGTTTLEAFTNLTMLSTDEAYAVDYLNSSVTGSIYLSFEDEGASGDEEAIRPANTSGATLSGGSDGLVGLVYTDFVGDPTDETGLYALNAAEEVTIVAMPDRIQRETADAMTSYCVSVRNRKCFAILDSPAGYSADTVIAYKATLNIDEQGALYWPQVKIINPSKSIFGKDSQITEPASGYLAGMFARNDATKKEGPFYQPAGTDGASTLVGVVDLETEEAKRATALDKVYPKRINPITFMKSKGIFVDGTRTLKSTGNFPSVGERRGVGAIIKDVEEGLQWVRHRTNTQLLRDTVENQLYDYLRKWTQKNVFASTDPATAFYIDVSNALNPPSLQKAGKLKIRIGLNTAGAIDWPWVEITKDTRAYDQESALAGL